MTLKHSIYIGLAGIIIFTITMINIPHGTNSPQDARSVQSSTSNPEGIKSSKKTTAMPLDNVVVSSIAPVRQKTNEEILHQAFIDYPEYKQAYYSNLRRQILRSYGDLARRLSIDPRIASRVSDLLVERALSQMDATELLKANGKKMTPDSFATINLTTIQGIDDDIKNTLGEEKYAMLKNTPKIVRYENEIKTVYSVDFISVNEPLNSEQIQALAVVMATNLNPDNSNMQDAASWEGQFLTKGELAVLKGAKGLLSENQISALKQKFVDRNIEKYYASTVAFKKEGK